jgi:hypothetical protein
MRGTTKSTSPDSCCILSSHNCFYFYVSWGLGDRNAQQLLYPEQPQLFLFLCQLGIGGQKCPAASVSRATPTVFISRSVGDWGSEIPSSCCIPSNPDFLFLGQQLGIGGHNYLAAAVLQTPTVFISRSVADWGTEIPSSCCIPSNPNCFFFLGQLEIRGQKYPAAAVS